MQLKDMFAAAGFDCGSVLSRNSSGGPITEGVDVIVQDPRTMLPFSDVVFNALVAIGVPFTKCCDMLNGRGLFDGGMLVSVGAKPKT